MTGTSCAALPSTAGGPDLGFLAPELYAVAASEYSASFNDIVKGNNDVFGLGKGYEAGPGYDLASGLGSPDVTNGASPGLAAYVCAAATGTAITPPLAASDRGAVASIGSLERGEHRSRFNLPRHCHPGPRCRRRSEPREQRFWPSSGSSVDLLVPASVVTAAAPAFAAAGPARVTLTISTPNGTVSTGASGAATYQYLDETGTSRAPTVSGIGPSAGSPEGGNVVTVYGSDFASSSDAVSFGGRAGPSPSRFSATPNCVSWSRPRAPRPRARPGPGFYPATTCQVEVVVTNADGTSPPTTILPAISGPIVFSPMGVVEPAPGTEVAPSCNRVRLQRPPGDQRALAEVCKPVPRSTDHDHRHRFQLRHVLLGELWSRRRNAK